MRRIDSPSAAIETGIGMVHRHFKLVFVLTVVENIHLGWEETPWRETQCWKARIAEPP